MKRSSTIGDIGVAIGVSSYNEDDFAAMALEGGLDVDVLKELYKGFSKSADNMGMLSQKAFNETMQTLQPPDSTRPLEDRTLTTWWRELQTSSTSDSKRSSALHREPYCNFKQLASWYASNTELAR